MVNENKVFEIIQRYKFYFVQNINFKILLSLFSIYLSSCSSWDKKSVSQKNGENFFIKVADEKCNEWIKLFDEVLDLSEKINNKSAVSARQCIEKGPDDSDKKIESIKDLLFERYESIVMASDFESFKLDNCFGAPASNFLNAAFVSSLNGFYNAKMLCSQDVQKLFRTSKTPAEYIDRFKNHIKLDYDRLQKIDARLSIK